VRIAPSPTGNLHVGTARAALFNLLFARSQGGEFVLRIEDTDVERSDGVYEQDIVDGLRWLGIAWDNDRLIRQSERGGVYRARLEQLLSEGKAVVRTFTDEEKEEITKQGRAPRDSIITLTAPPPDREIVFEDLIRGRVAVRGEHVGSLALAKDLDTPLYNFAVVVDDAEMGITHVIRGEDHISNTPKQLLMYEAMGAEPPRFAHLPLVLGTDRSKLSKRHGATSVNVYRDDYLPESLINFLGLLGYTYDREILSLDEMVEQFELEKVHKSGAIFDTTKLDWMNAQYVRALPPDTFKRLIGREKLTDAAVPLITERLERLSRVEEFSYLWQAPEVDISLIPWKDQDSADVEKALSMTALLADHGALNQANVDGLAEEHFEGNRGRVFWPLRVALSGRQNSAGPLEIVSAIGMDEAKARIERALRRLNEK